MGKGIENEGQKEKESDGKVTEKKLTVGATIKIVVLTIFALIGFFGLWGLFFFLF